MHLSLEQWFYVVGIAAIVVPSAWWLIKQVVRIDQGMRDIRLIKVNHLPHIEHFLRAICRHLGVEYVELEDYEAHKKGHPDRD
jgi:hypothetical protein